MRTADFRQGRPAGGGASCPPAWRQGDAAPDYHALGAFSETWAFLELFVGRCLELSCVGASRDQPLSLNAKLDALAGADLGQAAGEAAALIAEIRALALRREAVLQDLARASLSRLGHGLFAIPGAALGQHSAAAPLESEKALEGLHLKTCDLVRRSVLLMAELEKRAR